KQGEERLRRVRKLEWLQSFFRRLLEIWLVADRGLALQEAGFHVELHQFCDKSVSPRNLLIRATR
ncbi:MAG: methyltransferase, partial [Oceanospirillum sp.]|nr:methyltransferase [Oceanospirillum sp.]